MMGFSRFGALAVCIALAACDAGGDAGPAANDAAVERNVAAETTQAGAALPPCPFRETGNWAGSVRGGRLLVTGNVDLQMAGFRPMLSPRSSAPPTAAFDLALAPEAGAAVSNEVDYEATGTPAYRRGEIWCGGERIAEFEIVAVG